jgi:hypothetical protein
MLIRAGSRELESDPTFAPTRIDAWLYGVERSTEHLEAKLLKRIADELTGKLGRQGLSGNGRARLA